MTKAPTIIREAGKLYVMTAVGRCEIVPSHGDRTKPRWWRLVAADGTILSPYVAAPRIAAAWAAVERKTHYAD